MSSPARVHPTAIVEAGARLEPDTVVGPYAVIEAGAILSAGVLVGSHAVIGAEARVAARCRIGPHVVLEGRTTLGEAVVVHAGAVLGGPPQDRKYRGEATSLEIGDGTVIREHATVHAASVAGGVTRIGPRCLLMAYTHVAHDCDIGAEVVMANGVQIAGHCVIEAGAVLGGVTTVHQHVRIGRLAMTGASTRVARDIPPFCLADGNPARLRGLNRVGLERAGFDTDRRRRLERAFRKIFVRGPSAEGPGSTFREVLSTLERETDPDLQTIVSFVRASRRGLTSARRR